MKFLALVSGKLKQLITPDHHAGVNKVESGEILEVTEGKNMISHGLEIDGCLEVNGYLIIGV